MKVALLLQEAKLPFKVFPVDTMKGEQHAVDFRKINPNGKLPAIDDNGTVVFDSNAILLYLAEKTNKFLGKSSDRGALLSWLMFIASGLGPYSSQAVHFQHMSPEKIPYAINRYRKEAVRHYSVLNERLEGREYLVGGEYTIADIACWGWIDRVLLVLGEGELGKYPNLERWFAGIDARPAVKRARAIGTDYQFKSERDEVALRALFPQNYDD